MQDTFELLAPAEQRTLALLLPPPDRDDITAALSQPAFSTACQRFLRLFKAICSRQCKLMNRWRMRSLGDGLTSMHLFQKWLPVCLLPGRDA